MSETVLIWYVESRAGIPDPPPNLILIAEQGFMILYEHTFDGTAFLSPHRSSDIVKLNIIYMYIYIQVNTGGVLCSFNGTITIGLRSRHGEY